MSSGSVRRTDNDTWEARYYDPEAAARLSISRPILRNLRKLSSGPERKATGRPEVLSAEEQAWLEVATRLLARRVGQAAAASPLSKLTMADLPRLR